MPRRRRTATPARYFHVINRSAGRQSLFQTALDYGAFVRILRDGLTRHPVRLVSYCLLPNHWHLIVGPVEPTALSPFMHWVTTTHAVRWRRHRKSVGEGPVYQSRFKDRPIESPDGLMRACRYVERNALQAGLVERAQDWPWCSLAARLLRPGPLPIVDTPFLVSDGWLDYVNAPRRPDERAGVLRHVTEPPRAGGLQGGERRVEVSGRDDEHQAHSHVERAKRLGVVKATGSLQPREHRGNRPASAVK